jgi:hypothetical protein
MGNLSEREFMEIEVISKLLLFKMEEYHKLKDMEW